MPAEPVRLGMLRLTDAAPLVQAHHAGLFAAHGVDVVIRVEPSWANIADKLAWGLLDGAVMPPPLAIAMATGLRPPVTGLLIPAGISLAGNAITLARPLADTVLPGPHRLPPAETAARLHPYANGLRLAVVHAFSTHDLLLRRFLEHGGIDPASLDIRVLPPAEMPASLAAGRIDGFCAGAPWGAVAAGSGAGRTVAVTSQIWPNHPEKCLAVAADWATSNPAALHAILRALHDAGQHCDRPESAPALAALLARPEWVGVEPGLIAASLPGADCTDVDRSVFAAHAAQTPRAEDGLWFLRQLGRTRPLPADAESVVAALYRPDLHAQAAGKPIPHAF